MAAFFTQNDSRPSHASGPVNDTPTKEAGTNALAYWHSGNFVGGPEIFGSGVHLWSGVAATNCSVVQISGKTLRTLRQASRDTVMSQ